MLDLRGAGQPSQPERPPTGVPTVGSNDVSFEPPVRRSSPILNAGGNAPTSGVIAAVAANKKDPIIMVVAISSVAIAGAVGLFASYLATQEQVKLQTNSSKHDQLTAQLATGELNKQFKLIQTTSSQLSVLVKSKSLQTPWVSLLDALGGQVPGAIQLSNASFDSETKALTLSGNASTYDDVAHIIAAIDASDRFSAVVLQNTAVSQNKDSLQAAFSIIAQYVPITPSAPKNVPVQPGGTQ